MAQMNRSNLITTLKWLDGYEVLAKGIEALSRQDLEAATYTYNYLTTCKRAKFSKSLCSMIVEELDTEPSYINGGRSPLEPVERLRPAHYAIGPPRPCLQEGSPRASCGHRPLQAACWGCLKPLSTLRPQKRASRLAYGPTRTPCPLGSGAAPNARTYTRPP